MATLLIINQVSITSSTTQTAALVYMAILCLAVLLSIPFIGEKAENGERLAMAILVFRRLFQNSLQH